jgi:FRG domain-containing protein
MKRDCYMTDDDDFKWCYAKEFRVSDVEEAIELAEKFRQDGTYNWFRGQTKPWPPHATLTRAHLLGKDETEEARTRLGRFEAFMKIHPELQNIAENDNAFFAVAQHYGLPTPYIDFTTEPAIAGFFACDTTNPDVGSESCIYCLNTDDIGKAWETLAAIDSQSQIELVTIPVPNLWRLESQHGVFLYCAPGNWDVWYEMDKILFPYGGYPAYPPKEVIYPNKKSSLENLLDHFFVEERRARGRQLLLNELKKAAVPLFRDEGPPDFYYPEFFKRGQLEPHPSWELTFLKAWEDAATEPYRTMQRQPIPLSLHPSWSPYERRRRVTIAVAGALRIHPALRRSLVTWDFGDQPIAPHDAGNKLLQEAVEWLWDGMRRLPYSDAQIATAIGVCVQLASLGLSVDTPAGRQSEIALEVFGRAIEIEFGSPDGSYSRARAAEEGLRAAMRDDLFELVKENSRDSFRDTERVLLAVFAPQRLFDFKRLCSLFAEQLVSWQVLARRGRVVFFAPSRLMTLGLP